MLIILNLTGLSRVYWWPKIERQSNGDGLWYVDIRWLGAELILHSHEMGCEAIKRFGTSLETRS